jgi:hypothetical protein
VVAAAFEPLVGPAPAAVCFAWTAAHQIAPFLTPDLEALLDDPLNVEMTSAPNWVTVSGWAKSVNHA